METKTRQTRNLFLSMVSSHLVSVLSLESLSTEKTKQIEAFSVTHFVLLVF